MFRNAIRLLLCDLDGTLVDSFRDIATSCHCLLDELGGRMLHDDEIRPCIGRGVTFLVTQVLRASGLPVDAGRVIGSDPSGARTSMPLDEIIARYREIYDRHSLDATRPYPGVSDTLARLHDTRGDDLTLAVVSNKPENATREILAALDIGKYFSFVAGGDTFPEMKPSPLPLQRMMERAHRTAGETAIVGDSVYDLEAGKAAGIHTIAALYGFQDAETLKALDPDCTVSAFSGILRYV